MEKLTVADNSNSFIMVTIRCITYNHEPYIRQCLEGFIMQKTNFRFEAIVHDDASTDGTAAIIREYAEKYPEIIKPIYETENQYSKHDGSIRRIMNEHARGKYVAMCEGDDYWIDPFKLQKQVDFMEKNPDYGLIFSDVNFYYQKSGCFFNAFFDKKKYPIKCTYKDFLIKGWYLAPCTWLLRNEYLKSAPTGFIVGDLPILLETSYYSKVKFLPDVTAVYRVLKDSASHRGNFAAYKKYSDGIYKIQLYFVNRNGDFDLIPFINMERALVMLKLSFKNKAPLHAVYYFIKLLVYKIRTLKLKF